MATMRAVIMYRVVWKKASRLSFLYLR